MNTLNYHRLSYSVLIAISAFMSGVILSGSALAVPPPPNPSSNGAAELEVDGQPPSVSEPVDASVPDETEAVDVDVRQRTDWSGEEQMLQQDEDQNFEYAPDSTPPGSNTPGQDSPDQIEIPL